MEAWLILALAGAAAALAILWRRDRAQLLRALQAAWDERDRISERGAGDEAERRWLGAAAEATSEMVLVVGKDLRLHFANAAATTFFGPAAPESTLLLYTRSVELERLASDALLSSHPDGLERIIRLEERPCRARAQAGDDDVTIALSDVSEVQRLSRARQDLVANLSHELRTPLTSLRLLSDTLQAPAGRKAAVARELAAKISAEVATLQQMTEEMLDLAAIESGRQVVRLVAVPLADLVREPISRLGDVAAQGGVRLTVDVPEELRALADPEQASRAVLNVLHNAIKFSPPGGEVRITAKADPAEARVILSILDSGPGIPPDELERVFERFFRGDRARGTPGTGLGLAIARHILRAHGGQVWAENRRAPERGASFYLAFHTA
jgi:two-component system phosphate regulon sensor histidine kinase PhoR